MADREREIQDRDMFERGADRSMRGKARNFEGRVEEAAGDLTGDRKLQAEGKWDRLKGKVQDKVGKFQRNRAERREERNI